MKVKDVMGKDVVTVSPETTYEEAARLLDGHKVSGLPVVDKGGNLVGMLSEKDLFKALYPKYEEYARDPEAYRDGEAQEAEIEELRSHPIRKYMVRKVITISPNAPVLRAGGLMLAHGIHRLPVVHEGKLVGIVTREDIYGAILRNRLGRD